MQVPNLRYWRERRALTQAELAEKAEISVRSVANYETGSEARVRYVRKLAKALDVDVSALMPDPEASEGTAGKASALLRSPDIGGEEQGFSMGVATGEDTIASSEPFGRAYPLDEVVAALQEAGIGEIEVGRVVGELVKGRSKELA